jgi:hypothetical protein
MKTLPTSHHLENHRARAFSTPAVPVLAPGLLLAAALLTFAALLISAVPAHAQNNSVVGNLDVYPTYHALGVRLSFSGDADKDGLGRIEWRRAGETTWKTGMNMTRISGPRWAGSVLWLDPNASYEVRAVIDDADGGGSTTRTISTRTNPVETPSGRTWYVAKTGSDSNDGSTNTPLATIGAAMSRAQPGDEIRVRAGVYYETLDTPRSGTAAAPIHLVGDPGAVLDGSDPALVSGAAWRDDGGGAFSIPYTGTTRLVAADTEQRLYRQSSLANLKAGANGVPQGWVIEGGRLYVRLENGTSPAGHAMHVARHDYAMFMDMGYWRMSGFEVRYYGTTTAASGVYLRGATRCQVSNNFIHTIGGKSVHFRQGASENLIENNRIEDFRIYSWSWAATKAHEEEQPAIGVRGGRGNVIRYNVIRGNNDGIDIAGGETDENVGADTDVYGNLISKINDDCLEPETISGINTRLWSNRVDDAFSGMSIAPALEGPIYVLYNTFSNLERGAFKFSISNTAVIWICHNTVWPNLNGAPAVYPSGPYSNVQFRNNVLCSRGTQVVADDAGESQSGNFFNGDLLFTTYSTMFKWKGVNYSSLSALRSGTGFEMNGRSGDPLFTAASSLNFMPLPGSPLIDAAVRMPGINDSFTGLGPDIGAFENGLDNVPPARVADLTVVGNP